MVPCEKNLGGLAGQQSERRHAPHGIAGEKRAERLAEAQAGARGHAHPPAGGADREPQPREHKNRRETPADPLNAVENVGDARTPDDVREEDDAAERAGDGEQMPAAGGMAHGSVFTLTGHRDSEAQRQDGKNSKEFLCVSVTLWPVEVTSCQR